ncbi:hypothetical protein [Nostoc sp.]|uniref:hypothetical protein n=1 Tax=Nostoc sp. TaxID=1180 RepID=UPI002FF83751
MSKRELGETRLIASVQELGVETRLIASVQELGVETRLIASVQELGLETRLIASVQELGVKMTPTIKGWSLNEINLLFVSPIRVVSAVGRESSLLRTSHQPVI